MAVYAFESLQGLILSLLAFCSYYAHAFKFGLWARVPWKFTCRNSLKPRDEFLFFRGGVCFYFQQASGGTPAQVHRIRSLDLWVFLTIQVVYAFGLQNWTCYEISLQIFFFFHSFMQSSYWIIKNHCLRSPGIGKYFQENIQQWLYIPSWSSTFTNSLAL